MAYGDPVRIKIIKGGTCESVEIQYNKFAADNEIVASQYRIMPDGIPTICIWFKWDPSKAAYDEIKNDPKIMGDENES